jgi:hypothetical protein
MKLKGLHFVDIAEIQEAITDELKKFKKEEFLVDFQKLYDHAKACIYASGAYFELNGYTEGMLCWAFTLSGLKVCSPLAVMFRGSVIMAGCYWK